MRTNAGFKVTATRSVDYDAVAPTVATGTPDRAPDAGGWYNHPLNVTFTGTDAVSRIASCSSVPFSTNTTSAGTTVSGTCTDNAGNLSAPTQSQNIKYDATLPVNNGGTPDRASPDKDGWYNHALPIHFSGTFGGPSGPGGRQRDAAVDRRGAHHLEPQAVCGDRGDGPTQAVLEEDHARALLQRAAAA